MPKSFLTKKHARTHKERENAKKANKHLDEFYTDEQSHREKVQSIEEQIFEHLKEHTKKILKKNK